MPSSADWAWRDAVVSSTLPIRYCGYAHTGFGGKGDCAMTELSGSTSSAMPLWRRRLIGRLFALVVLLVAVAGGVWLERVPLLRGAADLWIVSDPVSYADVVAVLGGDV